jgi:hypothetical protein
VGLWRRVCLRRGRAPDAARSRPCGEAQLSCSGDGPLPRALAQLPVDCVLLPGGVAGAGAGRAVTHVTRSVAACNRGQPSSTSASMSGLSRPVLPCRLCQVMILLLLFLQKQSLAFAVYLFGIGTLHTGPGFKKKAHVIMLSP